MFRRRFELILFFIYLYFYILFHFIFSLFNEIGIIYIM